MEITATQAQANVVVTILEVVGELDGSNYLELIERVRIDYETGTRHLLLDMSQISFLSSAGLMALHSAALIMQGKTPPNPEDGWGAFHVMSVDRDTKQEHLKLLNPSTPVDRALQKTGMINFFDVFNDRATAVASF